MSLVCYKTNSVDLQNVIRSMNHCAMSWSMMIIDNSPTDEIRSIVKHNLNIEYIHRPDNPGFGAAHNIAIGKSIKKDAKYHFVVNPDVYFDSDIISPMVRYMSNHPGTGMMMPQILNIDGTVQRLPKLLPSPISILWRKIKKPNWAYQKFIDRYELRFVPIDVIYNAPILSGCFTLLNLTAIKELGMYDDQYFMYFEDWDLSRRVHEKYMTLYFPSVKVFHGYESGANKNGKLFKIFIRSAVHYFNKWGWFFDADRKKVNSKALEQFQL